MNVRLHSIKAKEFRLSIEVPHTYICLLIYFLFMTVRCFSLCREVLKEVENTGAREAGHDAIALEDLPAKQFSLGSCIGSTTMPGTSRTQRRRKPAHELIRRRRGTASPCPGALLAACSWSVHRCYRRLWIL